MKELLSHSLRLKEGKLFVLDQQLLPDDELWILVQDPDHMIQLIKDLKVRGAPLIGVAASLSLALWSQDQEHWEQIEVQANKLRQARPTAVNLMNNMDRMIATWKKANKTPLALLEKAFEIFNEDVGLCLDMARAGEDLISQEDSIVTHCNTGGLATVGMGTALGVIIHAHRQGKKIHVYVNETRPLLQGGRLTTWELSKAGVPHTLICDSMSAFLMKQNKITKAFVGADRIAMNGDFANKIGTYSLAVLCRYHKISFYMVAPPTTIDFHCQTGDQIPIEMRKKSEVRGVFGSFGDVRWAPRQSEVYNPAFDVTPVELLTGAVIGNVYLNQDQLQSGQLKQFA